VTRQRPLVSFAVMDTAASSRKSPDAGGIGIELFGITKRFLTPAGSVFTALRDVDLTIKPGQFCAVVGPTGCGKSTTLTLVAGLDRPSIGTVQVGGQPVSGITAGTSFMFQGDALLPWKTVLANVAMGPLFHGAGKKVAHARAREWLKVVGLAGFEGHHPHQLSGGMRKRVSLAGALINEPSILLMDEPFGALDVQTKAIMSNELLSLWEYTQPSVIFVTHDLEEAIALADRVVVMTAGPGTVKAVYDVDLPRPRGAVQEIRFEPRFLELHHQIWESLREEVQRAYARNTQPALAAQTPFVARPGSGARPGPSDSHSAIATEPELGGTPSAITSGGRS
jgi:NitT/TauT family transport system ATP-binding protein